MKEQLSGGWAGEMNKLMDAHIAAGLRHLENYKRGGPAVEQDKSKAHNQVALLIFEHLKESRGVVDVQTA